MFRFGFGTVCNMVLVGLGLVRLNRIGQILRKTMTTTSSCETTRDDQCLCKFLLCGFCSVTTICKKNGFLCPLKHISHRNLQDFEDNNSVQRSVRLELRQEIRQSPAAAATGLPRRRPNSFLSLFSKQNLPKRYLMPPSSHFKTLDFFFCKFIKSRLSS